MPLWDRVDAIFCSDPREKESPPYITKECDHHPGKQKEDPSLARLLDKARRSGINGLNVYPRKPVRGSGTNPAKNRSGLLNENNHRKRNQYND
jgi:hypothetical protein